MNILLDLFLTFAGIGLFTFGGGYAMISLLENSCVEKSILRFKKSPEEWYFTDWTDWNIGFSRTNCVWIMRGAVSLGEVMY